MCRNLIFGLILLISGSACNDLQNAIDEAQKEAPAPPMDNYIVLLDLSDRILLDNQQQVGKDLTIIKTIYSAFKSKLGEKDPTHLFYNVKDKLKLLVLPQRTTPKNVYDMVGNLRIELGVEQPEKKSILIDDTEKIIDTTLPSIYKQAVVSANRNDYAGADIWKYFNEDLEDDLEANCQNTLFIITDGYMDFENVEGRPSQKNRYTSCAQIINNLKKYPDWRVKFDEGDYGLLPAGRKFSNLKIVLLEVNPREDWVGEYHMLTRIWSKWFSEMGVSTYRFIKDDNINEVKESLEKFMQVKIAGKIEPAKWNATARPDSGVMIAENLRKDVTSTMIKKVEIADTTKVIIPKEQVQSVASVVKKKEIVPPSKEENPAAEKPGKNKKPAPGKTKKQNQQVSFGPVY